jgi:tetratricopeptide (TPR) repeat protein
MTEAIKRVAQLQAFLATDPANATLACDLVDAQFSAADYRGADATIAMLPADAQNAAGIRFRHARCALILGRYDEAVDVLAALIADGHDNVALWHDLAFAQLCVRKTADAAQTIAEAEKRFGMNSELAIVAARVALMDSDYERANAMLQRAMELAPEHSTAQGLVSLSLLDSGKTDEGYAAAKACLARFPDQHEALLVAGTAALWERDLDQADNYFQRALGRHPNSGRALSGYGQLLMLRNDLPAARDQLLHAVVTMPDHIGTWHALAWAQLLLGDIDAAATSYQHAYDLDRNFADSHGGLALIHALRGETDAAEQSVKRALRLNPQCATALYAKSLLLSDAGQSEEANALLATLVAQNEMPIAMDIADFARGLRARITTKAV